MVDMVHCAAVRVKPYFIWIGAAALLALFVLSMLYHTGGHLSLPLDDSFIYFQYASQAAQGHFLRYNSGDPPTTGATSLLYLAFLVPGYWLGFHGLALVPFALALGLLCLLLSLGLMRRLGTRLGGAACGRGAALLLLLCGPLLWGFFSGMEIGLFTTLILLVLYCFAGEVEEGRYPRTAAAAALLVLARPEGAVLAALLVLLAGWRALGQRQYRALWLGAPALAVFVLQGLFYQALTHDFAGVGMMAKWRFYAPHASSGKELRLALFDGAGILKGILGGSLGHRTSLNLFAYDGNYRRMFFGPFFLLFYVLGVAPALAAEMRARRPGVYSLGFAWLFGGVFLTCTLVEPEAHFNRYQQPFLPLFILFAVLGIWSLGRKMGEWGERLRAGLCGFYALWGLVTVCSFALAYGENCADIRRMQMAMARFIAAGLPAGSRVAINDAGVLRYLGGHPTVDLVGLTSPGFAAAWRQGSASLYERLEEMEPERRPAYFAIFPNWFAPLVAAGFLYPIHRVRLFSPSIVDAEKVLYKADWRLAGRGERFLSPRLEREMGELEIVDRIDVADLRSERLHHYRSRVREVGQEEANVLLRTSCQEDASLECIDGGRMVSGGEHMRVHLHPGRPARVLMRSVTGMQMHFAVYCRGRQIGAVHRPGGPGRRWVEWQIARIPAALVGDGEVELETRPLNLGDEHPIASFHYWFLQ